MKRSAHERLVASLEKRFRTNMVRHVDLTWGDVESRLHANPASMDILAAMDASGGEPDVIGRVGTTGQFIFCDCSPESPAGRRSLCYDRAAVDARKQNKPGGSALERAREIGIELLTEEQYRALQTLGEFDTKTSSWIATPPGIRSLGGALFCDRRYGTVFTYHNGAESYYAARGFRGMLLV